ncbi:hypothetical protein OXPF_29870 [Oxobacter pfennigii]|uniref:Virus attachment protein p12 family protein n=1 Tax=Oxobacter pfennigii TaxID=36849 RepID=A0A0P8WM34_9CLOT|nr:FeoB-associated Cys-rich membrane protein [Oxobacter pfennigii]KPU43546.1 hypothetical protein OXPF_29870 [Oxobacter pfennigii]
MSGVDYIVIAVCAAFIGLGIYKIRKDKKRGVKCPGCGECGGECLDK